VVFILFWVVFSPGIITIVVPGILGALGRALGKKDGFSGGGAGGGW